MIAWVSPLHEEPQRWDPNRRHIAKETEADLVFVRIVLVHSTILYEYNHPPGAPETSGLSLAPSNAIN